MNTDSFLVVLGITLLVWVISTPFFLFLRKYRVYRIVFIAYPAISRRWWFLLLVALALTTIQFFTSIQVPGYALWVVGGVVVLQLLPLLGAMRLLAEFATTKRGAQPPNPIHPTEFFISYNRETAEFARALWERLEALGIPVWFGERELLVEGRSTLDNSDNLAVLLDHGLICSKRCIALVSRRALTSAWVAGHEWKHYERREAEQREQLVLPVLTGPGADDLKGSLPSFLDPEDRTLYPWADEHDIDSVLEKLLQAAGLGDRFQPRAVAYDPANSSRHESTVRTPQRAMKVSVAIGPSWEAHGSKFADQPMALRNTSTGMHLNLIVGAMADKAVAALDEFSPLDVEKENVYAAAMFGMTRVLSLGVRMRKLVASHLINIDWTGGPPPWIKEVEKNVWKVVDPGEPGAVEVKTRQHLAFSYRSFGAYHRKYAILIRPGPRRDRKHFEFVFTAFLEPGTKGGLKQFLECIPEVDAIVRSLKVEQL